MAMQRKMFSKQSCSKLKATVHINRFEQSTCVHIHQSLILFEWEAQVGEKRVKVSNKQIKVQLMMKMNTGTVCSVLNTRANAGIVAIKFYPS